MLEYKEWIIRKDLQDNPEKIYVFGDNDKRVGNGGQAKECRGEPNALGIRVKRAPGIDTSAYYSDDEYEINCAKINQDIQYLEEKMKTKTIVFPTAGVGTGLAQLSSKAPRTLKFLNERLWKAGIENGKE